MNQHDSPLGVLLTVNLFYEKEKKKKTGILCLLGHNTHFITTLT